MSAVCGSLEVWLKGFCSTAATYQTLLNSERLAKFDPHQVTAVIIDEAHHAAAPSYVFRLLVCLDERIF